MEIIYLHILINKMAPDKCICLILMVLIIIFLLILLIKPKINEQFRINTMNTYRNRVGNSNKNSKDKLVFNLTPSEYYSLVEKNKVLNNYKTASSWESDSVIKNPKLNALMSIAYNRSCGPQYISDMGKYNVLGPTDFNLNSPIPQRR